MGRLVQANPPVDSGDGVGGPAGPEVCRQDRPWLPAGVREGATLHVAAPPQHDVFLPADLVLGESLRAGVLHRRRREEVSEEGPETVSAHDPLLVASGCERSGRLGVGRAPAQGDVLVRSLDVDVCEQARGDPLPLLGRHSRSNLQSSGQVRVQRLEGRALEGSHGETELAGPEPGLSRRVQVGEAGRAVVGAAREVPHVPGCGGRIALEPVLELRRRCLAIGRDQVDRLDPETIRPQAVRAEPVGPQTIHVQSVRAQPVGPEAVGAQSIRSEPVRTEAVGAQAVGAEAVRSQTVGTEAIGAEPVRTETVGSEAGQGHRAGGHRQHRETPEQESPHETLHRETRARVVPGSRARWFGAAATCRCR